MNKNKELMNCSVMNCKKTRMGIFRENNIDELKKQADLCEMCNNITKNKNTSHTFNSVSLRYKKLHLERGFTILPTG